MKVLRDFRPIFGLLVLLGAEQNLGAAGLQPKWRDVEFARIEQRALTLDLYIPSKPIESHAGPLPIIVWVHGGAWRSGTKENIPIGRFLERGFAIASVEYRLSPEANFPAAVHDIKAAIRFLRARAKIYGLDPERFAIIGASAGGHLAALVGVSNGSPSLEGTVGDHSSTTSAVQAIISFYGASNLQSILSQSTPHGLSVRVPALKLFLGDLPEQVPELAALASPVRHVDPRDPPLWLIHGDADPQMPFAQSRELEAAYRNQKLPVELSVVQGGVHGGAEFFTDQRLDQLAGWLLEQFARRGFEQP